MVLPSVKEDVRVGAVILDCYRASQVSQDVRVLTFTLQDARHGNAVLADHTAAAHTQSLVPMGMQKVRDAHCEVELGDYKVEL
jgi:hypothetical protein